MEVVNWVLWSIGAVVVLASLLIGICWTASWVTWIVTESRRNKTEIADRAATAHRWLSGFKDLDIIWDYIFGTSGYSDIDGVRTAYARARNTDVYGKPKSDGEAKQI